jgi:uncharacterized membrane protein
MKYASIAIAMLAGACAALAAEPLPMLSVISVRPGDTLNLREQPDARSRQLGFLAPTDGGITIVGQAVQTLDWIQVQKGRARGWANARFLAYGDAAEQRRLPVRLTCTGTEPFWSVEIGYGRADTNLDLGQAKGRIALAAPISASKHPNLWLHTALDRGDPSSLLIEAEACSDGMSERRYAYSVAARLGDRLYSGCCR